MWPYHLVRLCTKHSREEDLNDYSIVKRFFFLKYITLMLIDKVRQLVKCHMWPYHLVRQCTRHSKEKGLNDYPTAMCFFLKYMTLLLIDKVNALNLGKRWTLYNK